MSDGYQIKQITVEDRPEKFDSSQNGTSIKLKGDQVNRRESFVQKITFHQFSKIIKYLPTANKI